MKSHKFGWIGLVGGATFNEGSWASCRLSLEAFARCLWGMVGSAKREYASSRMMVVELSGLKWWRIIGVGMGSMEIMLMVQILCN